MHHLVPTVTGDPVLSILEHHMAHLDTTATHMTIADVMALPATTDVETAARALGIGRTVAYQLARHRAFPCKVIRVGRAYRVVVADLLRVLDVTLPTGDAKEPSMSSLDASAAPDAD